MCDDEIIKRRLLIDGDGTGEARIMTKFMKSFIKWCSNDESPAENQVQYDRLIAQLSNIESSSAKWANVIQMNEKELGLYDKLKQETNSGVSEATKSIISTKESLESAKKVRCNRMEYDALAKLIKEHPPRSDTANKLKLLNQELNSLKNTRDELEQRLNLRRKQMHVLVTALHQLQNTLTDTNDCEMKESQDNSQETIKSESAMEVV